MPSTPSQTKRAQKRYVKQMHKAGRIEEKGHIQSKIVIPTATAIGVHHRSVIRKKGGGSFLLDELKKQVKGAHIKCIGIKDTGWCFERGAFVDHGRSYGTILPAYGSREGVNRHVIAIVREKPVLGEGSRVFKIPLFAWTASNIPEVARNNKKIADKINKILPDNSSKFIKIHKIPEIDFEEPVPFSEGIIIEEHEFIHSGHAKDGRRISKNMAEELLDHPDELKDAVKQITSSVTKLFNHGILFTDTKAENFVREHGQDKHFPYGRVKIVDHEADYRSQEKPDLKRFGRALAIPLNDLAEHNQHLLKKNPKLKKEIEEIALDIIHRDITIKFERELALKYFNRNLRLKHL